MRETLQRHQVTPSSISTIPTTSVVRSRTYFTDTETDTDKNADNGEPSNNLSETFNEVAGADDAVVQVSLPVPVMMDENFEEEEELQGWLSPNELAEVHRRSSTTSAHATVSATTAVTAVTAATAATADTSVMDVEAPFPAPLASFDPPKPPTSPSTAANAKLTVSDVTTDAYPAPPSLSLPQPQQVPQTQPQARRRGRPPKRKTILDAAAVAPTPSPAVPVSPTNTASSAPAVNQDHMPAVKRGTKRAAVSDNNAQSSGSDSSSSSESDSSSNARDKAAAALMAECEVLLPTHMRATRTMRYTSIHSI